MRLGTLTPMGRPTVPIYHTHPGIHQGVQRHNKVKVIQRQEQVNLETQAQHVNLQWLKYYRLNAASQKSGKGINNLHLTCCTIIV